MNIKRLAYELTPPPPAALRPGAASRADFTPAHTLPVQMPAAPAPSAADAEVERIVQKVLAELKQT